MKSLQPVFFLTALILLVGLACSAITGGDTPPTQSLPPTQTSEPVQVLPTDTEPAPEPTEAPPTEAEPTDVVTEAPVSEASSCTEHRPASWTAWAMTPCRSVLLIPLMPEIQPQPKRTGNVCESPVFKQ